MKKSNFHRLLLAAAGHTQVLFNESLLDLGNLGQGGAALMGDGELRIGLNVNTYFSLNIALSHYWARICTFYVRHTNIILMQCTMRANIIKSRSFLFIWVPLAIFKTFTLDLMPDPMINENTDRIRLIKQ